MGNNDPVLANSVGVTANSATLEQPLPDLGAQSFEPSVSPAATISKATEPDLKSSTLGANPDLIDAAQQQQGKVLVNHHHHATLGEKISHEHEALRDAGREGSQSILGAAASLTTSSTTSHQTKGGADLNDHILGMLSTNSKKNKAEITDDAELAEFMRQHPELSQFIQKLKEIRDESLKSAQQGGKDALQSKDNLNAQLDVIATLLEGSAIAPQLRIGDLATKEKIVAAAAKVLGDDELTAGFVENVWDRAQKHLEEQTQADEKKLAQELEKVALEVEKLKAILDRKYFESVLPDFRGKTPEERLALSDEYRNKLQEKSLALQEFLQGKTDEQKDAIFAEYRRSVDPTFQGPQEFIRQQLELVISREATQTEWEKRQPLLKEKEDLERYVEGWHWNEEEQKQRILAIDIELRKINEAHDRFADTLIKSDELSRASFELQARAKILQESGETELAALLYARSLEKFESSMALLEQGSLSPGSVEWYEDKVRNALNKENLQEVDVIFHELESGSFIGNSDQRIAQATRLVLDRAERDPALGAQLRNSPAYALAIQNYLTDRYQSKRGFEIAAQVQQLAAADCQVRHWDTLLTNEKSTALDKQIAAEGIFNTLAAASPEQRELLQDAHLARFNCTLFVTLDRIPDEGLRKAASGVVLGEAVEEGAMKLRAGLDTGNVQYLGALKEFLQASSDEQQEINAAHEKVFGISLTDYANKQHPAFTEALKNGEGNKVAAIILERSYERSDLLETWGNLRQYLGVNHQDVRGAYEDLYKKEFRLPEQVDAQRVSRTYSEEVRKASFDAQGELSTAMRVVQENVEVSDTPLVGAWHFWSGAQNSFNDVAYASIRESERKNEVTKQMMDLLFVAKDHENAADQLQKQAKELREKGQNAEAQRIEEQAAVEYLEARQLVAGRTHRYSISLDYRMRMQSAMGGLNDSIEWYNTAETTMRTTRQACVIIGSMCIPGGAVANVGRLRMVYQAMSSAGTLGRAAMFTGTLVAGNALEQGGNVAYGNSTSGEAFKAFAKQSASDTKDVVVTLATMWAGGKAADLGGKAFSFLARSGRGGLEAVPWIGRTAQAAAATGEAAGIGASQVGNATVQVAATGQKLVAGSRLVGSAVGGGATGAGADLANQGFSSVVDRMYTGKFSGISLSSALTAGGAGVVGGLIGYGGQAGREYFTNGWMRRLVSAGEYTASAGSGVVFAGPNASTTDLVSSVVQSFASTRVGEVNAAEKAGASGNSKKSKVQDGVDGLSTNGDQTGNVNRVNHQSDAYTDTSANSSDTLTVLTTEPATPVTVISDTPVTVETDTVVQNTTSSDADVTSNSSEPVETSQTIETPILEAPSPEAPTPEVSATDSNLSTPNHDDSESGNDRSSNKARVEDIFPEPAPEVVRSSPTRPVGPVMEPAPASRSDRSPSARRPTEGPQLQRESQKQVVERSYIDGDDVLAVQDYRGLMTETVDQYRLAAKQEIEFIERRLTDHVMTHEFGLEPAGRNVDAFGRPLDGPSVVSAANYLSDATYTDLAKRAQGLRAAVKRMDEAAISNLLDQIDLGPARTETPLLDDIIANTEHNQAVQSILDQIDLPADSTQNRVAPAEATPIVSADPAIDQQIAYQQEVINRLAADAEKHNDNPRIRDFILEELDQKRARLEELKAALAETANVEEGDTSVDPSIDSDADGFTGYDPEKSFAESQRSEGFGDTDIGWSGGDDYSLRNGRRGDPRDNGGTAAVMDPPKVATSKLRIKENRVAPAVESDIRARNLKVAEAESVMRKADPEAIRVVEEEVVVLDSPEEIVRPSPEPEVTTVRVVAPDAAQKAVRPAVGPAPKVIRPAILSRQVAGVRPTVIKDPDNELQGKPATNPEHLAATKAAVKTTVEEEEESKRRKKHSDTLGDSKPELKFADKEEDIEKKKRDKKLADDHKKAMASAHHRTARRNRLELLGLDDAGEQSDDEKVGDRGGG